MKPVEAALQTGIVSWPFPNSLVGSFCPWAVTETIAGNYFCPPLMNSQMPLLPGFPLPGSSL